MHVVDSTGKGEPMFEAVRSIQARPAFDVRGNLYAPQPTAPCTSSRIKRKLINVVQPLSRVRQRAEIHYPRVALRFQEFLGLCASPAALTVHRDVQVLLRRNLLDSPQSFTGIFTAPSICPAANSCGVRTSTTSILAGASDDKPNSGSRFVLAASGQ